MVKPVGWPPPPRDPRRRVGFGALSGRGRLVLLVVVGLVVGGLLLWFWG